MRWWLVACGFASGASACSAPPAAPDPFVFTPSACGRATCAFADRIAAGATLSVTLTVAATGAAVANPTLGSSDPTILEVTSQSMTDPSTFVLTAHGAGTAVLIADAHDASGAVGASDRLAVDVAAIDDVQATVTAAGALRTPIDATTDQYSFAIGTQVAVRARPAADGSELTGVLTFAVTIDSALVDNVELGSPADADFTVITPAGTNAVTFAVPGGAHRTVELVGS